MGEQSKQEIGRAGKGKGSAKKALGSRSLQVLLSLSFSAVLFWWFSRQVEWQEVWQEVQNAYLWYLVPVTVLFIAQMMLRAKRWQYLMGKPESVSFGDCLDGIVLGNFGNYVLPLRAGEFIRPLLVRKPGKVAYATALVSVVVERILDLAAVLLMFALMLSSLPNVPAMVRTGSSVLGTAALGMIGCLLIAAAMPKKVRALASVVLGVLPEAVATPLLKIVDDVLVGAKVFRAPSSIFAALVGTAVVWLICYLQLYVSFMIFGIHTEFWHAIALGVITGLAIAAPSAPGFVGVYQVACLGAFALCGLDESKGGAFALITHLHNYVLIIGWGLMTSTRRGIALGKMAQEAAEDSGECSESDSSPQAQRIAS